MNREEYEEYAKLQVRPREIMVNDVQRHARTLAFGYDTDANSWHIYVMNEQLNVLIFWDAGDHRVLTRHLQADAIPAEMMRPNKRVYPDTVDRGFAEVMRMLDAPLTFIGQFDFSGEDVKARERFEALTGFKTWTHLNV